MEHSLLKGIFPAKGNIPYSLLNGTFPAKGHLAYLTSFATVSLKATFGLPVMQGQLYSSRMRYKKRTKLRGGFPPDTHAYANLGIDL